MNAAAFIIGWTVIILVLGMVGICIAFALTDFVDWLWTKAIAAWNRRRGK